MRSVLFCAVWGTLGLVVASADSQYSVQAIASSGCSEDVSSSYDWDTDSNEFESIEDYPEQYCYKDYEVYSTCPLSMCSPKNCSQLGYSLPCPRIDPETCEDGCVCESGYVYNDYGQCIPKKKCPSCGGDPNAVASECGRDCRDTCKNHNKKYVACNRICLPNTCQCRPNYVYDDNTGKCVLPYKCTPTCRHDEVYSDCTNGGCDARNCTQVGFKVPCVKLDAASCIKGCVCRNGYVRNAKGVCIPKTECPSCGGDPNAVASACGNNCKNTCANYGKTNVFCSLICKLNGCQCKPGYVYDDNLKKCVIPKDCTATCKINEIYSSCGNGLCRFQNCTQYGQPIPFCPRFDQSKCKGSCICANGFLRDPQGVCIPQKECPATICKNNQVYSPCVNGGCKPTSCSQLGVNMSNTTPDPASCKRGCLCQEGYLKNDYGECVPIKECRSSNTTTLDNCGDAAQRLFLGNKDFTGKFLSVIIQNNPGQSVVMSPFSVLVPLGILALNTKPGESYNQLTRVLGLKTKDEIKCAFREITKSFESQTESELDLSVKVYVAIDQILTEQFTTEVEEVFDAEAENIDFTNSENASDTINKWVEEKTKNRIKNLVSPSMFSKLTRLVLVNAIYFLGNWVKQFNVNSTYVGDFYVNANETIQRNMMYRKGSFKYAVVESLSAKALEIPYKGNFTYLAILPNAIDGYKNLAKQLEDPNVFNGVLANLSYSTCQVYLPRYDTTTKIDLSNVLNELNVTDVFNSNKSDLNGIIKSNEKLGVSSAVHQANINVTETGTEAAAANAIVISATAVFQTNVFKADHSFIYYLLLNGNPLFCGAVTSEL